MPILSNRTNNLQSSPIREILSVIDKPGMVSFAGGLPAQASFPELSIEDMPARFLQYGESAGDPELRQQICLEMNALGLKCKADQVIVLSGSQQGIDLVAKLFVDPGTKVAVETPTYLAALQVFRFFGAQFCSIDSLHRSQEEDTRLLYAIPTFQNPSGRCYTEEERRSLANLCLEKEIPFFEDDPYRDLVFEDCYRKPVCSFMESGTWVYQGSFSKSFAPGLRLGFLVCSDDLKASLHRLKQATDLHSSRLSQWLTLQLLLSPERKNRNTSLCSFYKKKRDHFASLLSQYFATMASWDIPKGGLFFWLKLNKEINANELLKTAIAQNVAFMPGDHFLIEDAQENSYIRLNFSHADEEEAERGLITLANLLSQSFTSA